MPSSRRPASLGLFSKVKNVSSDYKEKSSSARKEAVKLSGLTTLFLGLASGSAAIVAILAVALMSGPLV